MRAFAYVVLVAALLAPTAVRAQALAAPGPAYAADRAALASAARGATLEALPDGVILFDSAPYQPVVVQDPRYRWRFTCASALYMPAASGGLVRRVSLHYNPDDHAAALRTARLLARLMRLHRGRLGRETTFARAASEARVWLTPETPPNAEHAGGANRDNHIYVFATAAPRQTIEWTRTVAHEWGHLTLPAARGFTSPENDAAGYLGERLYLKWLYEETSVPPSGYGDGADPAGLKLYYERQVAPLIARFQQAGPSSPILEGRDGEAMDLYVGGVLSADSGFGSALTGRALFSILGERPADFFKALSRAAADRASLKVRLPAWVPLDGITYRVLPEGGGPATVTFADRPPIALISEVFSLKVRQPGWKWVRVASGALTSIVLQRGEEREAAPR